MVQPGTFIDRIFTIRSEQDFNELALELFHHQYGHNEVYRMFSHSLGVKPSEVHHYSSIPFLPIEFFKTQSIITGEEKTVLRFTSSGTTGNNTSVHRVADSSLYERSFTTAFRLFYGDPASFIILALLPSYLEQENSSLVYMVRELIRLSGNPGSGFLLNDPAEMHHRLQAAAASGEKTILWGVSYALMDFCDQYAFPFPGIIVMETGGMKGRRMEITREELHGYLKKGFGVQNIHSEYGMTELLSQAYSNRDGRFRTPPWMKVMIRESDDPLTLAAPGKTGGINVIDLANVHSCAFIATQDLGKIRDDATFEVLGRFDNSDVRGCNLLIPY